MSAPFAPYQTRECKQKAERKAQTDSDTTMEVIQVPALDRKRLKNPGSISIISSLTFS